MKLPTIPSSRTSTRRRWSTWIFTGFLLGSAVLTPLLGKLGDQHRKNRLVVISQVIFLVGSIGASAAWNVWSLIGFRAVGHAKRRPEAKSTSSPQCPCAPPLTP